MNSIDKIYVINLEHRKDRLTGFMNHMKEVGLESRVERIPAIYIPEFGALGATKSHLLALDTVIKSSHKHVLICEDDFRFRDINLAKDYLNLLDLHFINLDYDVISFSANHMVSDFFVEQSPYGFLYRAKSIQTASAYLVNKNFAQDLYNNLQESVVPFQITKHKFLYALDIYWKRLQPYSKWFLSNPILGYQEEGYSDIELCHVNYHC